MGQLLAGQDIRPCDPARPSSRAVEVSVLIVTQNGGARLQECIEKVLEQECDFHFELVLVDGYSNDGIPDSCNSPRARVRKISPREFTAGQARNFGCRIASGEIIANLSQDAVPADKHWLANLIAPFHDPKVAAVQGEVELTPAGKHFFWDEVGLFDFTHDMLKWNQQHRWINLSSSNSAVRKSAWEQAKYAPAPVHEDKSLQQKLEEQGCKIAKAPMARVYREHQFNLATLFKECLNEGLGWRCIGLDYAFRDMLLDLFSGRVYKKLLSGLSTGRARSASEIIFPIARPTLLFVGNRFIKHGH